MSYQNNNSKPADQPKREKERDIWNAQGLKSFVKAKTDYFNGQRYDSRLHLSFVEHSGRPACQQLKNVEVGVPMVKAGSDGNGRGGITALGLCRMIQNGIIDRRAADERKNFEQRQAQNPSQRVYHQPIWSCIGGTTAERAKDGKAEFRKVELIPGTKPGTYAFAASSCEGEMSNALGGVQPKREAAWTRIIVPVDGEYLYAFAEAVVAEWNAHVAAREVAKAMSALGTSPQQAPAAPAAPAAPVQAPMPAAPAPAPVQAEKPKRVYVFYDDTFYGPMACALSPKTAIAYLKKCLKKMQDEHQLSCHKEDLDRTSNQILNDETPGNRHLTPGISLFGKGSTNPSGDAHIFVMVVDSVG